MTTLQPISLKLLVRQVISLFALYVMIQLHNFNQQRTVRMPQLCCSKEENAELVRLCLRATPAPLFTCRLPPSPEHLPSSVRTHVLFMNSALWHPEEHLPFTFTSWMTFFFFTTCQDKSAEGFMGEQQVSAILGASSSVKHRSESLTN